MRLFPENCPNSVEKLGVLSIKLWISPRAAVERWAIAVDNCGASVDNLVGFG